MLLPLSRDKGTAGQAKLFCPGTKGQRDREFFLSRDKGTTGCPVPVCPGTSRPLKTLPQTLSLSIKNPYYIQSLHKLSPQTLSKTFVKDCLIKKLSPPTLTANSLVLYRLSKKNLLPQTYQHIILTVSLVRLCPKNGRATFCNFIVFSKQI